MSKKSRKLILKKKRKLWQAHIKAWSESSMTQAEYCRQNELSIKSFGYWKRKQPSGVGSRLGSGKPSGVNRLGSGHTN